MDCRHVRQQIEAEIESTTAFGGRFGGATVEARLHLDSCPRCAEFRNQHLGLNDLLRGLGQIAAPPDFDVRLRAKIAAADESAGRRFFRFGSVTHVRLAAVAASLTLVATATVIYWNLDSRRAAESSHVAGAAQPAWSPSPSLQSSPEVASADPGIGVGAPPISDKRNSLGTGQPPRHQFAGNTNDRSGDRALPASYRPASISRSIDAGIGSAKVTNLTEMINVGGPIVQVPISASGKPVEVLLNEPNGEKRRVSLKPVTFGSQNMIDSGATASAPPPASRGVW
jgi:hypothetical protein